MVESRRANFSTSTGGSVNFRLLSYAITNNKESKCVILLVLNIWLH